MANIWKKKYLKNNKSAYEIGKELNIGEEKVKEIINGEREVPTNEVDRVNEAFSTNKENEAPIERTIMEQFFKDNTLKQLRKDFGYDNINDMVKAMDVSVGSLYNIKSEHIKDVSYSTLKKAYDFFQDGFNKKVKRKKRREAKKYKIVYYDDLSDEVRNWYENTDLKELRKSKRLSAQKLLEKIGFDYGYNTAYYAFETRNFTGRKTKNCLLLQQLYNYYHGLDLIDVKQTDEDYESVVKSINKTPKNENVEDLVGAYEDVLERKQHKQIGFSQWVDINAYRELEKEVARYRYLIDKLMEKENETTND